MPWMYVRAISMRLLRGRSTPARRAMPLPLPLLVARVRAQHAHHARATDDFAVFTDRLDRRPHLHVLPRAPRDPAPRQVERRDLDRHLVTRRDAEGPHAHRAGDVGQHLMAVVEQHAHAIDSHLPLEPAPNADLFAT